MRRGELLQIESLSELGIFGTFLRRGDELLVNKEAGHLVRTKVDALSAPMHALHGIRILFATSAPGPLLVHAHCCFGEAIQMAHTCQWAAFMRAGAEKPTWPLQA